MGVKTDPCVTPFLRRCTLLRFLLPVVRVKQQLATSSMIKGPCASQAAITGVVAMPYRVVGCCEINKHSPGLLSHKAIFNVILQHVT